MTWYVYILRCGDDTLYCGSTNDLEKRFQLHCSGKGAKYTRGRGPLELVYWEQLPNQSDALKRECAIKRLTRPEKLKLIEMKSDYFVVESDISNEDQARKNLRKNAENVHQS